MNEDAAKLHALAWQLLANEGGDSSDPARLVDAANEVCRKLRRRLGEIIGQGGFAILLEHAVKLTRADFPSLPLDLATQHDPFLKGIQESRHDAGQLESALTTLWANLLASLVSLIGRDLSLTLLRTVWPGIDIDP